MIKIMKRNPAFLLGMIFIMSCAEVTAPSTTENVITFSQESQAAQKTTVPVNSGPKWKNWFIDADADSFGLNNHISGGDSVPPKYKKKQPIGYVSDSTDCDDTNASIHPGALEILNGLDDNCNGQVDEGLIIAGITLTTTPMFIPEYMGCGGTSKMFEQNDPNSSIFYNKMKAGNFNSFIHAEGGESNFFHWKTPLGTAGSGLNPSQPCDSRPLGGYLCKSQPRDFNLSWLSLCRNTGAKAVYACNIQSGTLDELKYAITQMAALPGQTSFVILYGQEGPSNKFPVLTAQTYPPKFYAWVDSINKAFPQYNFFHVADMPNVNPPKNGKYDSWSQEFINYRKPDPTKVAIREYLHGFDQYGQLTGDAAIDSAMYSAGIKKLHENIHTTSVAFNGCLAFCAQNSSGVPGYAGAKVNSRCVDMFYYLRSEKEMIQSTYDGNGAFIGSSIIGLKSFLNTLDFQWFAIKNRLYINQRYYVTTTSLGPQVDILAGYSNGTYYVELQNRSGLPIALPEYWNMDGVIAKPVVTYSVGYACTSLSSTTGVSFDPLANKELKPFSISEIEFHKP